MREDIGRIGVLFGGPSSERDISIISGNAVYDSLFKEGLDVVKMDIKDADSLKESVLTSNIDVAFIALHGKFGEDGQVQSILEDLDIPYTGSNPYASKLALDKVLSKEIFKKNNIPTPGYAALKKGQDYKTVVDRFSFPFVVKPSNGGSSIGISLVEKPDDIKKAIDNAFSYDDSILIEKYIKGIDITVGILDDEALPVIHIKPKDKFYDFKAKYTSGMSEYIVPADISDDIFKRAQKLSLLAHKALGCLSFSRVDMLYQKDTSEIFLLEVNTIPGLTPSSLLPKAAKSAGIDFSDMCISMVKSALKGVIEYG